MTREAEQDRHVDLKQNEDLPRTVRVVGEHVNRRLQLLMGRFGPQSDRLHAEPLECSVVLQQQIQFVAAGVIVGGQVEADQSVCGSTSTSCPFRKASVRAGNFCTMR